MEISKKQFALYTIFLLLVAGGTSIAFAPPPEDLLPLWDRVWKVAQPVSVTGTLEIADGASVVIDDTTPVDVTITNTAETPVPVTGTVKVTEPVSIDDNDDSITIDDGDEDGSITIDGTVTITDDDGSITVDDGDGSLTVDGTVNIGNTVTVEGTVDIGNQIINIPKSETTKIFYDESLTSGNDLFPMLDVSEYEKVYIWVRTDGDVDLYHSWNLYWEGDEETGIWFTHAYEKLELNIGINYFEIDTKGDTIVFRIHPLEDVGDFYLFVYGKPY